MAIRNPEDIADYMNKHFAAIGPNIASKIHDQVNEDNITPQNSRLKNCSFNWNKVEAYRVLKLLIGAKNKQGNWHRQNMK